MVKKGILMMVAVFMLGMILQASDLYKEGFKKGYQDGVMRIVYFVSPTEGKPEAWAKGYKAGYDKGLKVKLDGNVEQFLNVETVRKYKLEKELKDVLNLYGVTTYAGDETAYELYRDASLNLARKIIDNFDGVLEEEAQEDVGARGQYLNEYVDFLGNLGVEERNAYMLTNKRLIEFFETKYLWAKDNGSRLEMKLYGDALKKVQFLVGRGA